MVSEIPLCASVSSRCEKLRPEDMGAVFPLSPMPRKDEAKIRCAWAKSEAMVRYHDEEWGVPVHDDRTLFEFLILEGAQAGLSWSTILNKRENYRRAFDGFDAERIAIYDQRKLKQLLRDPGIVRNRLKITATVDPLAREDLAFALSVVLLGLLMMVSRRNAVSQVVGFMSLENGLVLAGTGARGMPLVVEISVAFSVLIAFFVIGVFLFRIRERFDTVDVQALDRFRGERR